MVFPIYSHPRHGWIDYIDLSVSHWLASGTSAYRLRGQPCSWLPRRMSSAMSILETDEESERKYCKKNGNGNDNDTSPNKCVE